MSSATGVRRSNVNCIGACCGAGGNGAADHAGVEQIVCITEGIPAHDMLEVYHYLRPRGIRLLGPNCPGALSPGIANIGIIPAEVFTPGPVGLVSRSGTLTYQIL